MALVRLTTFFWILSCAWTIHGASFPSKSFNASQIPANISAIKPQDILHDLQAAASGDVSSISSVSAEAVSPPSIPAPHSANPAYSVPSYAAPLTPLNGPAVPGLSGVAPYPGLAGFPGLVGFGGGLPGLFPFLGGVGGSVGLDASAGGYFPIVEKVVLIIGGGIILLIIFACIQGSLMAGGMLNNMGHGFLDYFTVPEQGFSASSSVGFNKQLDVTNNQVQNSINKQF